MKSPNQPLVLVIDDYAPILTPIKYDLEAEGFRCATTSDWDEALDWATSLHPELIVIDIVLKDEEKDGIDLAREIRELGLHMPIIFFTKFDNTRLMERSLNIDGRRSDFLSKGADQDSMVLLEKSDGIEKLVTLVKARLSHYPQQLDQGLRLDRERRIVERWLDDAWVDVGLERLEYNLLVCLLDAQGAIIGKWTLIETVFTENEEDYDEGKLLNRLYTYVYNINRKLTPQDGDFNHIVNRRGIGYLFLPDNRDS